MENIEGRYLAAPYPTYHELNMGMAGRCAKFKNGCRMPQLSWPGRTTSRLAWSVS